MASAYTDGPVCPGYIGVTHGFYSVSHFKHQSCANNVQRLPRIHSHIRGLFWTSKLLPLESTSSPPLITQLPVCTSLSMFRSIIIVIQYQSRHSNVIKSKKRNALTLRIKVALINEPEAGNSCRQLCGI